MTDLLATITQEKRLSLPHYEKCAPNVLKYSRRKGGRFVSLKIRGEIEDNFLHPFSLSSEWKIKIYGFVSADVARCWPLANGYARSIYFLSSRRGYFAFMYGNEPASITARVHAREHCFVNSSLRI